MIIKLNTIKKSKKLNKAKVVDFIVNMMLIFMIIAIIIGFILVSVSDKESTFKITIEYPQDKAIVCYTDSFKISKGYCKFSTDDIDYIIPKDKVYIEEIKK